MAITMVVTVTPGNLAAGEAIVAWTLSNVPASETVTGFQVLLNGKIVAEPVAAERKQVIYNVPLGNHSIKVIALVQVDVEAEATLEADDGQPPRNLGPPTITGTVKNGQVLTCLAGGWRGKGVTFTYRWVRCQGDHDSPWQVIAGATSETYTPTSADVGNRLRCVVVGKSASGALGEAVTKTTSKVAA